MKVVEIFKSIDGEGIRTGYPATFVRLYGCNLHCSYCDSRYACEQNDFKEMTVDEIVSEVAKLGVYRVTLTGGEPLIHKQVYSLIAELTRLNYEVNIETNGSVDIDRINEMSGSRCNIIVTMDWKCGTSNMSDKMSIDRIKQLKGKDVLKFVVGSNADLEQMHEVLKQQPTMASVFVSPVFGFDPVNIVQFLIDNDIQDARVQIQLHKIIWDPNKRGV